MSSAVLVSLEEYLNRTEKPHCEFIDGVLRPKPMPTKLHALIQFLLVLQLRKQNVDALQEVTIRLGETKFFIPDVIAARNIQHPYPTEPVLLCIEILSPETRLGATFAKCEDYHAWGVPYCWVIDPMKRSAWEYHRANDPVRIDASGTLAAGELRVRLEELVSQIPPDVQ
jgi:Uma2 family endonuclease